MVELDVSKIVGFCESNSKLTKFGIGGNVKATIGEKRATFDTNVDEVVCIFGVGITPDLKCCTVGPYKNLLLGSAVVLFGNLLGQVNSVNLYKAVKEFKLKGDLRKFYNRISTQVKSKNLMELKVATYAEFRVRLQLFVDTLKEFYERLILALEENKYGIEARTVRDTLEVLNAAGEDFLRMSCTIDTWMPVVRNMQEMLRGSYLVTDVSLALEALELDDWFDEMDVKLLESKIKGV